MLKRQKQPTTDNKHQNHASSDDIVFTSDEDDDNFSGLDVINLVNIINVPANNSSEDDVLRPTTVTSTTDVNTTGRVQHS